MTTAQTANLHLLSRNPVFTASKNVWGYEIQSAAGMQERAELPDQANVGAAVIAGDYVGLNSILARNKKLILSYSREQLLEHLPGALPARSSVVLVAPGLQHDESLVPVLERLAADGHTIALEWDGAGTAASPALGTATMLCLASADMAAHPGLAATLGANRTCLVRGVTAPAELAALQQAGGSLFQGRFFKTPEIIPGRRITSHQNSRLQLLGIIEEQEPDLDRLARTIQTDVTLSYRLLTYLNSPTFGFMRKIDSIRHAITLLGWVNVRKWLRAVLLADMVQGEVQGELLYLSLRRGRFLEQVVQAHDYWGFRPDEMFLLGMFSLLDAILAVPMADALAFLPLTDAQKKALLGHEATEYAPLMTLTGIFEDGDETARVKASQDLGLDAGAIGELHREAGAWSASLLDAGQAA